MNRFMCGMCRGNGEEREGRDREETERGEGGRGERINQLIKCVHVHVHVQALAIFCICTAVAHTLACTRTCTFIFKFLYPNITSLSPNTWWVKEGAKVRLSSRRSASVRTTCAYTRASQVRVNFTRKLIHVNQY